MLGLLLLAVLPATGAVAPLRAGCSVDAAKIATVGAGDRMEVLSALAGEEGTCYRIAVTRPGQTLTGYVLGDTLPAIAAFVRERERISEAAAEAEARRAAAHAAPREGPDDRAGPADLPGRFEDFSGRDTGGRTVSLSGLKGRAILVTFWSPKSPQSRAQLLPILPLYRRLHSAGLEALGVSMDPNPDHIGDSLEDVSLTWPQIPDQSGLARRYHVDPRTGETFVLDSSHRIVAAGPMGPEIEKAVRQLLDAK
jgi:peroxiredoxin